MLLSAAILVSVVSGQDTGSSDEAGSQVTTATPARHRPIGAWVGHALPVEDVILDPLGRRFFSSDDEGRVLVWSVATGELERVLRGHRGSCFDIDVDGVGERIASCGVIDGTARVWNIEDGSALATIECENPVVAVALDPSGESLAVVWVIVSESGYHSEWAIHRVEDGARLAGPYVYEAWISALAWRGGERPVWFGDDNGLISRHAWSDGAVLDQVAAHGAPINELRLDPSAEPDDDLPRFLSASDDGILRLSRSFERDDCLEIKAHGGPVYAACFSRGGRQIAGGGADLVARVFEASSGEPVGVLAGHADHVQAMAAGIEPGHWLTAGSEGAILAFDPSPGPEQLEAWKPTTLTIAHVEDRSGERDIDIELPPGLGYLPPGAAEGRIAELDPRDVLAGNANATVLLRASWGRSKVQPDRIGRLERVLKGRAELEHRGVRWISGEVRTLDEHPWLILDFESRFGGQQLRQQIRATSADGRLLVLTLAVGDRAVPEMWEPMQASLDGTVLP